MYRVVLFSSLALAWLAGCDSDKKVPAPSRYEAVTVKQAVSSEDLAGFCDLQNGATLSLPPTTGPASQGGGPRWINVWATWCKSCVNEMPMIERWRQKEGFSVSYVSADEDGEALDAFRAKHPELPETAVLTEPDGVAEWMVELGLDEGAGLPLHLFVSSDDKIRCARAAAVDEHHLAIVKALLR